MIVSPTRLIGSDGRHFSLVAGRDYEVLGIEGDWYRILDETPEPVLFEPECFRVLDATEPSFWVSTFGDDSERYAYPAEWCHAGFFEDFFDRVPAALAQFSAILAARFPMTASRRAG